MEQQAFLPSSYGWESVKEKMNFSLLKIRNSAIC